MDKCWGFFRLFGGELLEPSIAVQFVSYVKLDIIISQVLKADVSRRLEGVLERHLWPA
jgi:hypothetical protein